MLRYVLLAVMCSVGIKDCDDQTGIVVQMLNLRNSTEYLLQNPNVKLLELEQTERNLGVQKRYTMGARVSGKWECIKIKESVYSIDCLHASLGDKLVASADGGQTFPSPQDLKLTIDYPPKGIGGSAILSYVEIRVEQVFLLIGSV